MYLYYSTIFLTGYNTYCYMFHYLVSTHYDSPSLLFTIIYNHNHVLTHNSTKSVSYNKTCSTFHKLAITPAVIKLQTASTPPAPATDVKPMLLITFIIIYQLINGFIRIIQQKTLYKFIECFLSFKSNGDP